MKKKFPMRFISLILTALLLIGTLPFAALAGNSDASDGATYTVLAHGGIIENEKHYLRFDGTAEAGTALHITLDESVYGKNKFVCWRGDDGTEIPQKSFSLLVERNCAFYPVFSDLTGNFGEWRELLRGKSCDDGVLYVREDAATGLKEYKFETKNHCELFEQYDNTEHMVICSVCGYKRTSYHSYNSGVITTEPTHSTEGVKTYTCIECGYKKTEAVPAVTDSAHEYGEWEIITEAKDGQPGYRKRTCACGASEEGYYIKAEWEKYYKTRNVEMKTVDGMFGKYQKEWHYSFKNEDGNDVYIYMLKRYGRTEEDWANYGFMFVDD